MSWVSFIYSQMDPSLHTCCYTIHLITYLQFYLLKYNTLLNIFNYIYLNALVKTNCFLHSSANKKKKKFFFFRHLKNFWYTSLHIFNSIYWSITPYYISLIWQNFIQNNCSVGDSVPQEKEILRPPPQEVVLFPWS